LFAIIGFSSIVGFRNEGVAFQKTIAAQVTDMKAKYNEYFLKVREVAQVPKEQMEQLKSFYDKLITGRATDGAMFKFIAEQNPNIDQSTYVQIQRVIAAGRSEIYGVQRVHIDTVREYNTFITIFPNNMMAGLFNFQQIEATVPIADSVNTIFSTKVDQEINIFNK
jgi:hypothetical protein